MAALVKVPDPSRSDYVEVWLTRDCDEDGTLRPVVEVWSAMPHRSTGEAEHGAVIWFGGDEDDPTTGDRIAAYALEAAAKRFRTLPESDRECVRCWVKR